MRIIIQVHHSRNLLQHERSGLLRTTILVLVGYEFYISVQYFKAGYNLSYSILDFDGFWLQVLFNLWGHLQMQLTTLFSWNLVLKFRVYWLEITALIEALLCLEIARQTSKSLLLVNVLWHYCFEKFFWMMNLTMCGFWSSKNINLVEKIKLHWTWYGSNLNYSKLKWLESPN